MIISTRIFLLWALLFINTSCMTVYTEKQSQALSRVVYATKDSLDSARIDLADSYSTEATRIVQPPKERIQIQTVYKKTSAVVAPGEVSPGTNQRVVVIPSKYKNDIVVVVSSAEYEELLKDKEAFEAFKIDHELLVKAKQEVDDELIKQAEYKDQMVKDLNSMQRNLVELKLSLLKHRLVILGLTVAIAAGIYLRMKGIL